MTPVEVSPAVLVTGATGRQGGTGRAVLEELLAAGKTVRALVRVIDDRAEHLRKLGAEVVVGDFSDYASLNRALQGTASAYFCYPVGSGIVEAAGLFASAARNQGVSRVVDLSLGTSRPDSPSPQGRAQWVAEQIFEWAGIHSVHLRIAAFFMENICYIDGITIRTKGEIRNAFGALSLPWVSSVDVGRVAAKLLLDPDTVAGAVVSLGGVEKLSYQEIVDAISAETGRTVSYRELLPDEWRLELIERSRARGKENARGADHLVAQAIALREHPPRNATEDVRKFLGQRTTSFKKFISSRRAELTPNDA